MTIEALARAVDSAVAQLAEAAGAYLAEAHRLNAAHYGSPRNPGRYPHPVYENAPGHLRMAVGSYPALADCLGVSATAPRSVASLHHASGEKLDRKVVSKQSKCLGNQSVSY